MYVYGRCDVMIVLSCGIIDMDFTRRSQIVLAYMYVVVL